jgi:N utilization substance protein A
VAYSEDINTFLKYLLYPAKITKTEEKNGADGRKLLIIDVRPEDKGIAIGKNGRTIQKANTFVKRHFGFDSVIINTKS